MADLDLEQFEALMAQEQQEKEQQQPATAAPQKANPASGVQAGQTGGTISDIKNDPEKRGHHRGDVRDSKRAGTKRSRSPEQLSGEKRKPRRSSKGKSSKRRQSRSRSPASSHSDDSRKERRSKRGGKRDKRDGRRRSSSLSSEDEKAREEAKRQEALQRSLEEAKKQAEEAQRDDCTVLVTRIHLHSEEKEIYSFFAKAGVGKIRDIRIIRDQRSGKSKGIAYVEFYAPESVLMALAMSNQQIRGQTIMINASQAEKNRTAAANKYKKSDKSDIPSLGNTLAPRYQHQQREQNNRIYIGGLVGHLATLSQTDIRQFFSPFGQIDAIELPKDPYTGKNRGHSIVEFATHKEARIAAQSMNGFELMQGQKLKVNILTDGPRNENPTKEEDLGEDTANTYLHSASDRTALMQKLSRNKDPILPAGAAMGGADRGADSGLPAPVKSSCCLLFQGMFDPTQVDLRKDPSFFMDIKDQVTSVCTDFGKTERVYVEQNSDGHVWVQFRTEDLAGALRTQESLDNQLFDGNVIRVNFVTEADFTAKVKER